MAKNTRTERSLTMLTAAETLQISQAAQQDITTNETLAYTYRDEFLHIQRAAELGLKSLDMLVADADQFRAYAESWGFTVTGNVQTRSQTVFRTNLGEDTQTNIVSNITVDWSTPKPPTIDVAYYRQTGDLVSLVDSTQQIPLVDKVKARLGVTTRTYTVDKLLRVNPNQFQG